MVTAFQSLDTICQSNIHKQQQAHHYTATASMPYTEGSLLQLDCNGQSLLKGWMVNVNVNESVTVCALIFAGFNVRGFRGSAAIREYFVREHLNVTVNGHVHSSSQSMTSCVTKMAISRRRSWLLLPVTS